MLSSFSHVAVPSQVFSESVNHSGLQANDTAAVAESAEALRRGAMYADVSEGGRIYLSFSLVLSSDQTNVCLHQLLRNGFLLDQTLVLSG